MAIITNSIDLARIRSLRFSDSNVTWSQENSGVEAVRPGRLLLRQTGVETTPVDSAEPGTTARVDEEDNVETTSSSSSESDLDNTNNAAGLDPMEKYWGLGGSS